MELLRGQPARAAVRDILASHPLPAVAIDPAARQGAPISVLAVATPESGLLVDARGSDIADILDHLDRPLAAHDAKAVHRAMLATWGAGPERWACTLLSELLLSSGRPAATSLEAIAAQHKAPPPPPADGGFAELTARARAIARLIDSLIPEIHNHGLGRVSRIEAAAVAPIASMEHHGMPFDARRWRQINAEVSEERSTLESELKRIFARVTDADLFGGALVNLESDAELKRALHALGHQVPDVKRRTIARLPEPLGAQLARYRELSKITSTYGESFIEHVAADGRIHAHFEQIGASTGRMACHSPNLQAVVKGSAHRSCFRTSPGRRLVIGDYAACELRILAEMSGDPVFAEAFARGADLHARVASEVFKKPVSKTQNAHLRERAKAINFGLAYGMGAGGLARAIDADAKTAQELLERYFTTFPKIRTFLETIAADALARGMARTMTGRRLYLDVGADRHSRAQAARIAKNMPIQGTSADITKIALARLHRGLRQLDTAWIVNTVHDEIVVECAVEQADAVLAVLTHEMQAAGREVLVHTPVVIDATISETWDK